MAEKMKKPTVSGNGFGRPAPTHADYSDQVSKETLAAIQKLAKSKDNKDERWEMIHGGPAW